MQDLRLSGVGGGAPPRPILGRVPPVVAVELDGWLLRLTRPVREETAALRPRSLADSRDLLAALPLPPRSERAAARGLRLRVQTATVRKLASRCQKRSGPPLATLRARVGPTVGREPHGSAPHQRHEGSAPSRSAHPRRQRPPW